MVSASMLLGSSVERLLAETVSRFRFLTETSCFTCASDAPHGQIFGVGVGGKLRSFVPQL